MAELVDASDLKSDVRKDVRVQVPPVVPKIGELVNPSGNGWAKNNLVNYKVS